MTSGRPAAAVDRMRQVRGHTAAGLKQDVTVRVYGAGWGSLEIDGRTYLFSSRAEAVAMLDEYLRRALERAAAGSAVRALEPNDQPLRGGEADPAAADLPVEADLEGG